MDTLKIIGYVISLIGVALVVVSNKLAPKLSFLGAKSLLITIMAGLVCVILGVALIMMGSSNSSKIEQASEEVPIYHGEGKNRKIVGYQRASSRK